MKSIIIAVVAVVGIIGVAVVLGGDSDVAAGEPSNNFYGPETGIITVTEYGDFECPACAQFYPIISQVKEDFEDQIRFEFRHFPLVQIHPNATAAHRAAQAAANQGQFWEMHDILYERQSQWRSNGSGVTQSGTPISSNNPTEIFESYAQELGLNMEQYTADASASETLAIINADIDLGKQNDVSSTPTIFIDGVLVEDLGAIATVESFTETIQAAIDAKAGEPDATEQPAEEAAREEDTAQ